MEKFVTLMNDFGPVSWGFLVLLLLLLGAAVYALCAMLAFYRSKYK